MALILLLFDPQLFIFWSLGKVVLHDCGISLVSSKAGMINRIIENYYRYRFANSRSFDFCVCYFTVINLSIQTPELLIILNLKFEQLQFTTRCCV